MVARVSLSFDNKAFETDYQAMADGEQKLFVKEVANAFENLVVVMQKD